MPNPWKSLLKQNHMKKYNESTKIAGGDTNIPVAPPPPSPPLQKKKLFWHFFGIQNGPTSICAVFSSTLVVVGVMDGPPPACLGPVEDLAKDLITKEY